MRAVGRFSGIRSGGAGYPKLEVDSLGGGTVAIAAEQRQYQTYILSNGTALLEVVPERGGMITRWQVGGQDLLYLDRDRFANPNLSVRGGMPILFPICGNLPDNRYRPQGRDYNLKQHGFARDLPWQVELAAEQLTADQTMDQAASADPQLALTLRSSEQTRAVYPYDFALTVTYVLRGNTLVIQPQVVNHAAEPLPFSWGLHPYFQVTDKAQLKFDIPVTRYQNHKTGLVENYLGGFDFDQDEIDVVFRSLASQRSRVIDRDRHFCLTLNSSEAFSTLVFWTLKDQDFYCLEPWTAPRNALNTGIHLLQVPPGESFSSEISLAVEFFQSEQNLAAAVADCRMPESEY